MRNTFTNFETYLAVKLWLSQTMKYYRLQNQALKLKLETYTMEYRDYRSLTFLVSSSFQTVFLKFSFQKLVFLILQDYKQSRFGTSIPYSTALQRSCLCLPHFFQILHQRTVTLIRLSMNLIKSSSLCVGFSFECVYFNTKMYSFLYLD